MHRAQVVRTTVVALLLGVAFVALASWIAASSAPSATDRTLGLALLAAPSTWGFRAATAVSFLGSPVIVTALSVLAGLVCWRRGGDVRLAALCVGAPAVAALVEVVTKQVVARPRPPTRVLTGASGFGFPSGHTTGAAALAVVAMVAAQLLITDRRLRRRVCMVAVTYAVTVGISRVVVGAHYPSDVVGGLLVGTAAALGCALVLTRHRRAPQAAAPAPDPRALSRSSGLAA
ncbi:MAG TPA: phosphatase PAP2 family protein [Acidimicrobiia bacterium]